MPSRRRERTYVCVLLALGALLVWLALRDTSGIREFRGTLRTGVHQIGGETTGVIIVTSEGRYELDLKQNPEWRSQLHRLNGKQVTVEGKLIVGKGIEVKKRWIIHVRSLQPCRATNPSFPRGP